MKNNENKAEDIEIINEVEKEYKFEKIKYIGTVAYSIITTSVHLNQSFMDIKQEKKLFYVIKKSVLDTKINYSDIRDVVVKQTMDRVDLIYAIIFTILGFVQPLIWLLAILCLWSSYGKKIHVFTANNVFKIPTGGEADLQTMIDHIKKISPNTCIKN